MKASQILEEVRSHTVPGSAADRGSDWQRGEEENTDISWLLTVTSRCGAEYE